MNPVLSNLPAPRVGWLLRMEGPRPQRWTHQLVWDIATGSSCFQVPTPINPDSFLNRCLQYHFTQNSSGTTVELLNWKIYCLWTRGHKRLMAQQIAFNVNLFSIHQNIVWPLPAGHVMHLSPFNHPDWTQPGATHQVKKMYKFHPTTCIAIL